MAAPAISNLSRTVALQYNAIGSILYETDVGVYSYPASGARSVRPHAVTTVNGNTFGYDGNTVSTTASQYRSITYTSFNLPDGQAGAVGPTNGPRYTWQYDADHQRVKEVHTDTSGTRTTWYVHPDNASGLSYEYEVAANGTMTSRHYITAGEGVIAVLTTTGAYNSGTSMTITKTEYWHRDHLGSTAVTTDGSGNVTQRYAYDPFGKRRYTDGNYDSQGLLVYDYPNGTSRGFTGHEQLDDIGMVDMNGRLYDPFTGRFLQADPFVQSPGNLQSYNRYSYLYNNPLNGTDPSGYFSLIGSLEHAWKSIWHSSVGKIAVVVAVTWLGQYELSQYLIVNGASYTSLTEGIIAAEGTPTEITGYQLSALGHVTVGAASGFAGSYVGSNGNFKAGIQGAVVGGAFGYAGTIGQPDSMG